MGYLCKNQCYHLLALIGIGAVHYFVTMRVPNDGYRESR